MQTWASVEHGYWYARSPEFLQSGVINWFRWLRVIGDTIFAAGSLVFVWFVFGLSTGHSFDPESRASGDAFAEDPSGYAPARGSSGS
jgi:nitric oxide reductase subunit B